jgi:predicted nucleic acid-binding protein
VEVRILLDTNRYTDLARGVADVVARVVSASEAWLPLFALGELRAGFLGGAQRARNEAALEKFLRWPNTGVLLPDEITTRFYAQVYNDLRRQGTPISANDVWIAALAIQHNLMLDSRDQHFQRVPGLQLVDTKS